MTKLKLIENVHERPPQPSLAPLLIITFIMSLPFLFIIYTTLGV